MEIRLSDHFTFKRLIRFVLPSVIMMIVTSLYTVVDGFFVSNFVGKTAFAALNLIWPMLTLTGAAAFMLGSGGSALIAYTLGEGREEKAINIFSMLEGTIALIGVVIAAVVFIFMRPIAGLLGATPDMIGDCVLYGRILICAMPFYMLQNSNHSFLVTAEKPKLGLGISVAAGLVNIVLDFVLVYVFRLGIWGAAAATAFSQIVGGLIPVLYFMRKNSSRLCIRKAKPDLRALGKACTNGSSEMMSELSGAVVGLLYNYRLMGIAGQNGVAAYGAIMYVTFIFISMFFGYAMGSTPIVAYHYGAENREELKNLLKKGITVAAVTGAAMTAASEIFAPFLAKAYVGYDKELYDMTIQGLRLFSVAFLATGFNILGSAFFTGLNNGKISALISFLRALVLQVAAVLILPCFFGLKGIWLALPAADGVTLLVTAAMVVLNRKRYGYI